MGKIDRSVGWLRTKLEVWESRESGNNIYIFISRYFVPKDVGKKDENFRLSGALTRLPNRVNVKRDGSFASSQRVMPYSGNSPSLTSRVFDSRKL